MRLPNVVIKKVGVVVAAVTPAPATPVTTTAVVPVVKRTEKQAAPASAVVAMMKFPREVSQDDIPKVIEHPH